MYSYGTKHKTREFYVTNLIDELNLNEKAVRGAMEHLMYLDFIEYDELLDGDAFDFGKCIGKIVVIIP